MGRGSILDDQLHEASMLLAAGRLPEAIDAYRRLLAVHPNEGNAWYNLGYLLQRVRQFEAALDCYARVLELGGDRPEEVHLNRAAILAERLGQPLQAEAELRQALIRSPLFLPALLNLGNVLEHRGERDQAILAYEKVLTVDPHHALALSRLANATADLSASDPLLDRLRSAMKRPGVSAIDRADLGFALGAMLDRLGAYDEAFAAYELANGASRASAGPHRAQYDARAQERLVDALIRAHPESGGRIETTGGRAPALFICGMFRSGSTLVERILASHPRVTAGGELDLLPAIARDRTLGMLRDGHPIQLGAAARLGAEYRLALHRLFPAADVLTDKRPDNFLYIGLIKTMFPSAKIVHTRRNAMDNCLSIYFLHLGPSRPYATSLLDTAHWHRQYERLMAHWKRLFPGDIHDVDYDDLVHRPEPVARRLLGFADLEWDNACLGFHESRAVVRTASSWQVRRSFYTESSGRWRHYARHLAELQAALSR